MVTWAKVFGNLAKIFQQCCQNCLACVRGEPMKKRFSEKSFNFCLFCILSNNFWHHGVFFGYCSQENVYSRCPEDEFKENWKIKFFLSSYLQLIFPALRLRTELRGWGLSSFQCMRPVEPRGEEKNIFKVNTLFVVFGHWVIECIFCFWTLAGKKVSICQNCFQYVQKNGLRRGFLLKKLQFFIILNFGPKISVCWR